LRKEGKTLNEVNEFLEENKNRFHQIGWLDDLSFVAKKGRLSHAKAFMGKLIGIKPLGEFDYNGLTTVIGKAKGEKTAYQALLAYMEETIENPEEQVIVVAHSNRFKQAEYYKQLIKDKFNPKEIFVSDVYPACGINVGPGLMAAYYVGKPISKDLEIKLHQTIKKVTNDIEEMKALVSTHKCCGIMMELVQGEGGVMPLDKEYVSAVQALAKEEDLLLIIDEVQTGNGRTGSLYAFEQYGITPDVVTTAKGLGGGLPIGATMLGKKAAPLFAPGLNGSTFGGNPVASAGARSILKRIDEKLLAEVKAKSAYIFSTLSSAKGVKSVTGLGLMIGIDTERDASEIVQGCMQRGVLVIKAKNKVRLLPALNIPQKQLEKAIQILKEEIEK
jgi:hypothetical protein